jgi:hypothetical protein
VVIGGIVHTPELLCKSIQHAMWKTIKVFCVQ